MAEQIPRNSPADPTTTLAEPLAIDGDTLKIPVPVVYPLANMVAEYRLEVGAEPNVEYMQVTDVSGLAAGELVVQRAVEDTAEHPAQEWPAGTPVRLMLTHGAIEQILADYSAKFVHNDALGYPAEYVDGDKQFTGSVMLSAGVGYAPTEYTFSTPGESAGVSIDLQPLIVLTNPYGTLASVILSAATPGRDAVIVNRSTSAGSVMVTGDFFGGITTQPSSVVVAPGESVRVSAMMDGTMIVLHTPLGMSQKQPLDAQLTQLAALNPANDDFIQQKAGVLANRTLQQVRADLLAPIAIKPVRLATAAALPACTYNNAAGTLTATANGALTVDGVAVANGDAILPKNQSSQLQHGVYVVTSNGGPTSPWVLTRDPLFDATAEVTPSLVIAVQEGTSNADTLWMLTTNRGFTLGSSALVFTQCGGTQAMIANRNPATSSQLTIGNALVEKMQQPGIASSMAANDLVVLLQPGSLFILQTLANVTHGRRVKCIALSPGVTPTDKITISYSDTGVGDLMRGADWTDGVGSYEAYLTTDESYITFIADTINGDGGRAWRVLSRSSERGQIREIAGAAIGTPEIPLGAASNPVYLGTIEIGELNDKDEKWQRMSLRFAAGTRDFQLKIDGVDIFDTGPITDLGVAAVDVWMAKLDEVWLDVRMEVRVNGAAPLLFAADVPVDLIVGGSGGVSWAIWHSASSGTDTYLRRYITGVARKL